MLVLSHCREIASLPQPLAHSVCDYITTCFALLGSVQGWAVACLRPLESCDHPAMQTEDFLHLGKRPAWTSCSCC